MGDSPPGKKYEPNFNMMKKIEDHKLESQDITDLSLSPDKNIFDDSFQTSQNSEDFKPSQEQ
jgi:hypothetical protein